GSGAAVAGDVHRCEEDLIRWPDHERRQRREAKSAVTDLARETRQGVDLAENRISGALTAVQSIRARIECEAGHHEPTDRPHCRAGACSGVDHEQLRTVPIVSIRAEQPDDRELSRTRATGIVAAGRE